MSTVKSKKLQVGTDASASNNFTIYQPATPDGSLRIGVGNADNPTEVGRFTSAGYKPATAPAVSAVINNGTNQSISVSTYTKVAFINTQFDTTSDFDSTTNYRYTPSVAGYYYVVGVIMYNLNTDAGVTLVQIRKNNSTVMQNEWVGTFKNATTIHIHGLVYMNGTTDYLELYGYSSGGTPRFNHGSANTYLHAHLVQQA